MQLTTKQRQLIIGSLLGDGTLAPRKNRKNTRFSIVRSIKDIDYLEWQYSFLEEWCIAGIKKQSNYDKRTKKIYHRCYFCTLAKEQLTKISKEWYFKGKKCLPKQLKISPLCLAVWFLDDGSIRYTSSNSAIQMTFSTQSFTRIEVEKLAKLLTEKFGGYFGVYPNQKGYVISCSTGPAKKILRYIRPVTPANILPRKTKFFSFLD